MQPRTFELRIKLHVDRDDYEVTEQSVKVEIERLFMTCKHAPIVSLSVIEQRKKPSLVSAQRQFKIAVHGGWALPVPLEPVVIGKPCRTAKTIGEAVAKCLADGAQQHACIEGFSVLRIRRGVYIAIGKHDDGTILSARVLGQLVSAA